MAGVWRRGAGGCGEEAAQPWLLNQVTTRFHKHTQRWPTPVMLMQGLFFFFFFKSSTLYAFCQYILKNSRQQAANVTFSSCQLAWPSSLLSFLASPAFPFKSEGKLMIPCADVALHFSSHVSLNIYVHAWVTSSDHQPGKALWSTCTWLRAHLDHS